MNMLTEFIWLMVWTQ